MECANLIRMGHISIKPIPKPNGQIGTSMRNSKVPQQGAPLSAMLFVIYFDCLMTDYKMKFLMTSATLPKPHTANRAKVNKNGLQTCGAKYESKTKTPFDNNELLDYNQTNVGRHLYADDVTPKIRCMGEI